MRSTILCSVAGFVLCATFSIVLPPAVWAQQEAPHALRSAQIQSVLARNDRLLQRGTVEYTRYFVPSPKLVESKALSQTHQFTLTYNEKGQYHLHDRNGNDAWDEIYDGKHVFQTMPEEKRVALAPISSRAYPDDLDPVTIAPRKSYGLGHGLSDLTAVLVLAEDANTITISGMTAQHFPVAATLSKKHGLVATRILCYRPAVDPREAPTLGREITFSRPTFLPQAGIYVNYGCSVKSYNGAQVMREERYRVTRVDRDFTVEAPDEWRTWTLLDGRCGDTISYEPGTWNLRDLDTDILRTTRETVEKRSILNRRQQRETRQQERTYLLAFLSIAGLAAIAWFLSKLSDRWQTQLSNRVKGDGE